MWDARGKSESAAEKKAVIKSVKRSKNHLRERYDMYALIKIIFWYYLKRKEENINPFTQ